MAADLNEDRPRVFLPASIPEGVPRYLVRVSAKRTTALDKIILDSSELLHKAHKSLGALAGPHLKCTACNLGIDFAAGRVFPAA